MMTSLKIVFYLTCLFLGKMAQMAQIYSSVRREGGFISAHVGESRTLQCFYDNNVIARFYWYKQTMGQKPKLISTFYTYEKNGTFYNEYANNTRFSLETGKGKIHLRISDLRTSDSATYYCVSSYSVTFEFAEGVTVSVKDSSLNIQTLVHQSTSETIQSGDSVNLSCTVQTRTCDGEHSVYWFKHSEESDPGLIYTNGDRTDQCERKPNTQTQTCVYNLPMKNLNVSHTGTYYCAVVSCGHILFGNGTKVDLKDERVSLDLVYFLSGALTFTTILSGLLSFSLCVINKKRSSLCTEISERFSDPPRNNSEDEGNRYYKAVKENTVSRRRLKDDTWSECVYFSVKK